MSLFSIAGPDSQPSLPTKVFPSLNPKAPQPGLSAWPPTLDTPEGPLDISSSVSVVAVVVRQCLRT